MLLARLSPEGIQGIQGETGPTGANGNDGTGIIESSTSIRAGTGTAFHSTPTKATIYGQGSSAAGINAAVYGYGSIAGQSSIVVGNDNFISGGIGSTIAITTAADNVKSSAQKTILIAPVYTAANAYGGIYIGDGINVTANTGFAANTANNDGVYIGKGVAHIGSASYAGGVIIGRNNNGRDGKYPTLIGSSITTANNLQNSVVVGYNAFSNRWAS